MSDIGDCDQGVQALFQTKSNLDSVEQASGGARALLRGCPIYITYAGHSEDAEFIWRFGVLLAADARAQKLLPQLPLAPADEIAAVGG